MDEEMDVPTLLQYLEEQGKGGSISLREHLAVLGTYAEGLYENNAALTAEALDADALEQSPVELDQEESPYSIAYYLPDKQLIRVLPDYPFEIEEWEEVDDDEIDQAYDA